MKILRSNQVFEVTPRGYGLVRYDVERMQVLIAPVPLNLILRAAWMVWIWMQCPSRWSKSVEAYAIRKVREARAEWEEERREEELKRYMERPPQQPLTEKKPCPPAAS